MSTLYFFDVKFTTFNDNVIDEDPYLFAEGKISVKAKDIFEALTLANDRLKTFGFDHVVLNGAEREDRDNDRK